MIEAADQSGADQLIFVGAEIASALAASAGSPAALKTPNQWFADSTAAAAALPNIVRTGDLLLVKGSRGIRMERLIEQLEAPPVDRWQAEKPEKTEKAAPAARKERPSGSRRKE